MRVDWLFILGLLWSQSASSRNEYLIQTSWGQSELYQMSTPQLDGFQTYPGCTTVALAQILAYHRACPLPNTEVIYYWEAGNQNIAINLSEIPCRTDRFVAQVTLRTSKIAAKAVNDYIYLVGLSLKAQWNAGDHDTAAGGLFVDPALQHFGFDQARDSLFSATRENLGMFFYSNEQWRQMMIAEIDAGRPVLYSASSIDGVGHTFVIDGYDMNGLFHVNWGWGGKNNGFYDLIDIACDGTLSSPNETYCRGATMWLGIGSKTPQASRRARRAQ